ncbi:crotonobetainyl-CoA:carnitine CoA-transferase CaiB-like acyl-CoA transferase [Roseovarius sp. MBR-51]
MTEPNPSNSAKFLSGIRVVEIGSRISVGLCGSLLAEAGAHLFFIEPPEDQAGKSGKWANRALYAAGKQSVAMDTDADRDRVAALIGACDVVLLSSDTDSVWVDEIAQAVGAGKILCDFTAFGHGGPMTGQAFDDAMVQSICGVAHTTGFADGPPVALQVPLLEYSTGSYGAAAIVAALAARDRSGGGGQRIDMALYDSGVNSLATFLPAHFGGKVPMRVGNQHAMCAPWNAYQASDGWVLLCSASNPPWRRLCDLMDQPELTDDPKFADLPGRMENRDEVNRIVQDWIGQHSVATATELLMAANVACGPILRMEDAANDPNLKLRGMIRDIPDRATGGTARVPGTLLRAQSGHGHLADHVPRRGETEAADLDTISAVTDGVGNTPDATELPLAGLRVLEIGQYTTAPLSSRHLATLGAEVIKIEPPEGDAARSWLPHNGDLSIFFVMSNSGKTSLALNLKSEQGRKVFTDLLASADVLLENLKPGSLDRLGFGWPELSDINPRLIYCAISGFGAESAYQERPAFDTVVQAMAGLMHANAFDGTPLKSGVSACDFMGGQVGLFFVLAALRNRQRTGKGDFIDVSMQDVAVWMTAPLWKFSEAPMTRNPMLECADGYVCAERNCDSVEGRDWAGMTRDEAVALLAQEGCLAAPVHTIAEMVDHPQTQARGLFQWHHSADGLQWPLLGSPMVFSGLRPFIGNPIGKPRPVDAAMRAQLGIAT